jgi:hypothetical protein
MENRNIWMNTGHWTAKKMMYAGYLINYRHRNGIVKKWKARKWIESNIKK